MCGSLCATRVNRLACARSPATLSFGFPFAWALVVGAVVAAASSRRRRRRNRRRPVRPLRRRGRRRFSQPLHIVISSRCKEPRRQQRMPCSCAAPTSVNLMSHLQQNPNAGRRCNCALYDTRSRGLRHVLLLNLIGYCVC